MYKVSAPEAVRIFWTGGRVAVFCMLSLRSQLPELQTRFETVEDPVLGWCSPLRPQLLKVAYLQAAVQGLVSCAQERRW